MFKLRTNVLSAMLLVAGTCIGSGMIALPVAAGVGGFLPALAIMLVCWLVMTLTALLYIEVSLWHEEGAHMVTMCSNMLGPIGKVLTWVLYLLIAYGTIVACAADGGRQLNEFFPALSLGQAGGCVLFVLLFGLIVDFGARFLGRINAILMIAMIASYFWIVIMGSSEIKIVNLIYQKWSYSLAAVPFLLAAFSFQAMVPSLTPYLKRDPRHLYWALVGGTTLSLVIYVIWLALVLGIVDAQGFNDAFSQGASVTPFLAKAVQNPWLAAFIEFFAFFALVTTFLGFTFGVYDFLADGLHIPKKGFGKALLGFLIAAPTLYFSIYWENIFLNALDFSASFGDTVLNGMMPVLMVWIGRYTRSYKQYYRAGKGTLVITFAIFLAVFLMQLAVYLGYLPQELDVEPESLI